MRERPSGSLSRRELYECTCETGRHHGGCNGAVCAGAGANHRGGSERQQIPIATFDKEFELTPMAAESWTQSEDGLTWTFKLRPGLVWSDGEPLTAEDFVFALQRAATSGYDFAWYWDFAGGIKGWK